MKDLVMIRVLNVCKGEWLVEMFLRCLTAAISISSSKLNEDSNTCVIDRGLCSLQSQATSSTPSTVTPPKTSMTSLRTPRLQVHDIILSVRLNVDLRGDGSHNTCATHVSSCRVTATDDTSTKNSSINLLISTQSTLHT